MGIREMWMTRGNPVAKVWSHVHEPKSIAVAMSAAYLATFIVGAVTLKGETQAVDYIHGLFLVTGGAFGFPTALFGYYQLERAAIMSSIAGVITWLALTGLTSTGLLGLIVIVFFVTRWIRIKDFDVTPGEPVVRVKGITK